MLWPRLQIPVAEKIYFERQNKTTRALSGYAACDHPAQVYAATGGARAEESDVRAIRTAICSCAEAAGFPEAASDKHLVLFDRALAPELLRHMPMALAEAGSREVWNFVSLVVAPDVTQWRFAPRNHLQDERWLCSDLTRHMFSRLWWQAYLLVGRDGGQDRLDVLNALSESDLNQLLERTQLAGAVELLRAFARAVSADPEKSRDLTRNSAKRLLRLMAITDVPSLSYVETEGLAKRAIEDARHATSGSAVPPI